MSATMLETNVLVAQAYEQLKAGCSIEDVAGFLQEQGLDAPTAYAIADAQAKIAQENVQPAPVAAEPVKQSTPMPEPVKLSAVGASDFVDDAEIAKRIDALMGEGKTDKEIATQLAMEFEGDISDLIAAARRNAAEKVRQLEDEVETSHFYEDTARHEAMDMVDEVDAVKEDSDRLWLENYCLKMGKKMPIDAKEIKRYAEVLKRVEKANTQREEAAWREAENASLPSFPHLTGSLNDLAESVCPDLPYEFKAMSAITYWGLIRSGKDKFAQETGDSNFQTRFNAVFVAPPQRGKSASSTEIIAVLKAFAPKSLIDTTSVDSGPALVDAFDDSQKLLEPMNDDRAARVLLNPDELSDILEKSKTTPTSKNSLLAEFLRLFEGTRTGNRARRAGKTQLENCHLAIIGGATPENYQNMWTGTGSGATGLQSRFVVIGTDAPRLPIDRTPSDIIRLDGIRKRLLAQAQKPDQTITWDSEARDLLRSWWNSVERDKPSEVRVEDFVKRLLLVLAQTNDTNIVTVELVKIGIAFGDYVIAAREKYNPSGDAYTWTQRFENDIVTIFKKQGKPMTANEVRRFVHPDKKPGGYGQYQNAWRNLINTGVIKQESATVHNTGRYVYAG